MATGRKLSGITKMKEDVGTAGTSIESGAAATDSNERWWMVFRKFTFGEYACIAAVIWVFGKLFGLPGL